MAFAACMLHPIVRLDVCLVLQSRLGPSDAFRVLWVPWRHHRPRRRRVRVRAPRRRQAPSASSRPRYLPLASPRCPKFSIGQAHRWPEHVAAAQSVTIASRIHRTGLWGLRRAPAPLSGLRAPLSPRCPRSPSCSPFGTAMRRLRTKRSLARCRLLRGADLLPRPIRLASQATSRPSLAPRCPGLFCRFPPPLRRRRRRLCPPRFDWSVAPQPCRASPCRSAVLMTEPPARIRKTPMKIEPSPMPTSQRHNSSFPLPPVSM